MSRLFCKENIFSIIQQLHKAFHNIINIIWDEDKNLANIEKRGIAFEEILEVFDDPTFLTGYDFEHSEKEDRYYGIGNLNGILIV